MLHCRTALLLLLALLSRSPASADMYTEMHVEEAISRRFVHPIELDTTARLALATRHLAAASGVLFRGPTLSASLGPRRGGDTSTSTDVAIGLDMPLLLAGREQNQLASALENATPVLTRAASARADLEVELAFLTAWRDAEEVLLRDRELEWVDDWLERTRIRIEAGTEAPFRITVAIGERERVAAQRDQARVRALASRLALAASTPLPDADVAFRAPVERPHIEPTADSGVGLLHLAIELGTALESAVAALETKDDTARWAVTGDLASEGDEEVLRLGLAYRIPPRRERRSITSAMSAADQALRRSTALELADLDARLTTARRALEADPPTLDDQQIEAAFRALSSLVSEGKVRPSDVLAERRTLVEAQITLLDRLYSRLAASAELHALTRGSQP